MWTDFVDLIYVALFTASTALGGSMGWAIAVVSLAARLLLFPLTLRLAYRGLETQRALRRLAPQLEALRARHKKDPRRLLEETSALYERHGVRIADGGALAGMAVQAPIFLGLFGAIQRGVANGGRFLWVKDLAAPDALLAGLCAIVAAWAAALAPNVAAAQRVPMIAIPALLTFVFLARVAAGISVYSLASGLVGVAQATLVRRRALQFEG